MIKRVKRKVFTDEEAEIISEELRDWWDSCGDDCFVNDKGRLDESKVFTREEVYQMAADHIGWRGDKTALALANRFYQLDRNHPEKDAIIMKAFPFKVYGY